MRRLYLQIYLSFVAILLLLALLLSVAWLYRTPQDAFGLDKLAALAEELVPAPDAPPGEDEAALERLSDRLGVSLALYDERGRPIAAAGASPPLPTPDPRWRESRLLHSRGRGLTAALRLGDGRWLVVRHRERGGHALAVLVAMLLAAAAVAVGSYPLVRRLTRRLERLQERVEALGKGELGARVEVEGSDEVAKLALSFNEAAARIERLIDAERTLLAGVSHELRSPLARMRMAVELLGEDPAPAPASLRRRIETEIETLDGLIGELILATRIETRPVRGKESIDVLALAAEEASRVGGDVRVDGAPAPVHGDRAFVRRLLRNLLENARRHAPESRIDVDVRPRAGGGVRIQVMDRGPGVPPEERERIFEPFYQLQGVRSRGNGGGVGLGLALVKKIARLHGGDASCSAREGGGSVFEATLGEGETGR